MHGFVSRWPTVLICPFPITWDLQCLWEKWKSESEVTQSCPTLCDPWTVAHQAPLSVGFSRQEYQSGLPFPSPQKPTTSLIIMLLQGMFHFILAASDSSSLSWVFNSLTVWGTWCLAMIFFVSMLVNVCNILEPRIWCLFVTSGKFLATISSNIASVLFPL